MSKYRKALVAIAALAAVFGRVAADGAFTSGEILELVIATATVIGVYRIPNTPDTP